MRRIRSGRTRVLSKRGPSRRHFVPPTRMPARTSRSTSTIRNSRVSRSGRPYVEAKPRSPRVFPAWKSLLAIASAKLLLKPAKLLCGDGIRSVFSRCAEIVGETGADIGYEEFVNAQPALRELLLIKVGQESIQCRKAAFDRVVPDLRSEQPARSFHLVDDPGRLTVNASVSYIDCWAMSRALQKA